MPDPQDTFTVERTLPGVRLDAWLHERYPQASRGALQRMIAEGHVLVNGAPTKSAHRPKSGEVVSVHWPPARPSEVLPEAMPLQVLYEDDALVVLNKAPGVVVHPAAGHDDGTLVNALLHHCGGQLSGIGGVARPGIVHRLDRDTSGCLVVAKTDEAHLALAAQFADRSIHKVYHAIVCGTVTPAAGRVDAAIARHPNHRQRMAVTEARGGRAALTTYRVLERLRGTTLVEAVIHTGRTHQIRVHFQHLGHPVVGDETYGRNANQRLREACGYVAPRQMLHASRLEFVHPLTGQALKLEAPWPDDFQQARRALAS